MDKSHKAFVLMPFDPEFDSIYKDLIKPALKDAGYDVERADSFLDQQNILRDIVRGIATAHLIIADLTSQNTNVLYELGLCHGLQVPTILLAQSMDEIPFDLRSYRIQIYSTRFDQVDKLKQTLKELAEKNKTNEITFGSPITDFLPDKYTPFKKTQEIPPEASAIKATEEKEVEGGFLDFILEGERAVKEIIRAVLAIAEETKNTNEKIEKHLTGIKALKNSRLAGTTAKIHKIASIIAAEIIGYATRIAECIPKLEINIDFLAENFSAYIRWKKTKTEKGREQMIKHHQLIISLFEKTRIILGNARDARDGLASLKGISRDINRAVQRSTGVFGHFISALEKIEAFCAKTLPLIDEKLKDKSD